MEGAPAREAPQNPRRKRRVWFLLVASTLFKMMFYVLSPKTQDTIITARIYCIFNRVTGWWVVPNNVLLFTIVIYHIASMHKTYRKCSDKLLIGLSVMSKMTNLPVSIVSDQQKRVTSQGTSHRRLVGASDHKPCLLFDSALDSRVRLAKSHYRGVCSVPCS